MRAPRRRPRPRDHAWAGLALLLIAGYLAVVIASVVSLVRGGDLSTVLWTLVWGVPVFWFVLGAWRRTVWGARPRLEWNPPPEERR